MKNVTYDDEYYDHSNGIWSYLSGVDSIEIKDITEKKMQEKL